MSDSKCSYLFGPNYKQWSYKRSYLSFVTPHIVSLKITELANNCWNLKDLVVYDMFSGIGTDAIAFSNYAKSVVCTELLESRYNMFQSNLKFANAKCNMLVYNQDCCIDMDPSINIDVVFFDPPWGKTYVPGNDFRFENLLLDNGQSIIDLSKKMLKKYGKLIIKSPIKCESFDQVFEEHIINCYRFPTQKLKFLFITFQNEAPAN
jgi:16S rRNA G966 N2-methylase RsmD